MFQSRFLLAMSYSVAVAALGLLSSRAEAVPVALQQPTATFHQGNFGSVAQTIDGDTVNGGMGFFNNRQGNTTVVWETQADVVGTGLFTITINQNCCVGHTLQQFRLSATGANRADFANGLPTAGSESPGGDIDPAPGFFSVLQPVSMSSTGGATFTADATGLIKVSGNNAALDTYTIVARAPINTVTGLRLEVQPGADGFVGRSAGAPHNSNGNLVVTEFAANFTPDSGDSSLRHVRDAVLTNATATFDQGGAFTIGSAINGVETGNDGWAIFGQQTQAQTAVFQTSGPIDADLLEFNLLQQSPFGAHKIQNFRLSFTTDANPTATDANIKWTQINPDSIDTSLVATTGLIQGDNSILVSGGNGVPDNYRVLADGVFRNVTGFRLEVFPVGGTVGFPGANGNIVLSEFNVLFRAAIPEPASASLLVLSAAALLRRRRAA